MSKKDNFNQAMYDMFGVGKTPDADTPANADASAHTEAPARAEVLTDSGSAARSLDAVDENILSFRGNDTPDLRVVPPPQPTYLAPGARIEGTLRSEGPVEIDGEFRGDIISESSVTIRTDVTGNITAKSLTVSGCSLTGDALVSGQVQLNEDSSINGDVSAGTLFCSGSIVGDLAVQHNVTLNQRAKVVGSITAGTMTMAQGAIVRGSVEVRGEAGE